MRWDLKRDVMHKYVYCVSVYVPVCTPLHVWHSPRVRAPPDGRVCGAAPRRHAFAGGDGARLRACTHTAGLSRSSQAAGDDSRAGHAGRHARVWQGTHTRGRARPPPLASRPGHMCAHACPPPGAAPRLRLQEMRPAAACAPQTPRAGNFGRLSAEIRPPQPPGGCGAGVSSGHPLAAPMLASLRSMQATVRPFIYSNINIFAFRPQPKRDKALPRGALHCGEFDKAANATRIVRNGSGCLCAS